MVIMVLNAADLPLSAGKLVEVEIGDDQQDDGQHEVQVSEYGQQ